MKKDMNELQVGDWVVCSRGSWMTRVRVVRKGQIHLTLGDQYPRKVNIKNQELVEGSPDKWNPMRFDWGPEADARWERYQITEAWVKIGRQMATQQLTQRMVVGVLETCQRTKAFLKKQGEWEDDEIS